MNKQIENIIKNFKVKGNFLNAQTYGSGHIHDTYLVNIKKNNVVRPFLLQRINRLVFNDPPALMENIVHVTNHIRKKLEKLNYSAEEISRRVLTVISNQNESNYFLDQSGDYWRLYLFINGAVSFDSLNSLEQIFEVAKAFGKFLSLLQDFPGNILHDTIPDFHNGLKRWREFQTTLIADSKNRAIAAKEAISFLSSKSSLLEILPNLLLTNFIPMRVCHNDTKVNNVLLDNDSYEGLCVLDLDTVMNGTALFDFGDLGRSTLSSIEEDCQDLSGFSLETSRFEALVKGFLIGVGDTLTRDELDYLVFSVKLMPLIIGMRFLSDYLAGDVYFKVHRQNQNLERCLRQFQLVQAVCDREEELNEVIQRYCNI